MDKKLIDVLEPIEDEFDVMLLTEEDSLDFVKADKESISKLINSEIEFSQENEDFANGLRMAQAMVNSYMQVRIDEGY